MLIEEKNFLEPADLLNYLSTWNNNLSGYVFRGHSKEKYKLLPSVLRDENRYLTDEIKYNESDIYTEKTKSNFEHYQIQTEYILLRKFYKEADRHGLKVPHSEFLRKNLAAQYDYTFALNANGREKWIPDYLLETAALAQHYGLPTRLLDWTNDPLIAAHFALKGAINGEGRLVIWCLNANSIATHINLNDHFPIKLITPPYFDNQNLSAQKGLFTHLQTTVQFASNGTNGPEVDRSAFDEKIHDLLPTNFQNKDKILIKLTLPSDKANIAYDLLERHGYGEARIYPGYEGIVKQTIRAYKSRAI